MKVIPKKIKDEITGKIKKVRCLNCGQMVSPVDAPAKGKKRRTHACGVWLPLKDDI